MFANTRKKLETDGYASIKGFYDPATTGELAAILDQFRSQGHDPSLVEARDLLDKLFSPRVHEMATELLGGPPVVFADIQIKAMDFWSSYAWHKDCVDRQDHYGADWKVNPYPILRFGVYFQDYEAHSGAVAMQAGSHRGVRPDLPGRRLRMAPGDLGLWYLTTNHSANTPSFRWRPDWAPVPPRGRLRSRLAYAAIRALDRPPLTRPRHRKRQVIFFALGLPSEALARYISYILHRRYFHAATASLSEDDPLSFLSDRGFRVLKLAPLRAKVDPANLFDDYTQTRATAAAEILKAEVMEALGTKEPVA